MLNTDCTVFWHQRIEGGGSKILDCIVLWVSKEKGVPKSVYRYSLCPFKRGIESISLIILNRQFIVTKTHLVKYVASNVHRAHPSAAPSLT